jgi:pyruvate/2-oxoglutarate dehydrogenase complex dihydrolipoamide acyltransferase (E2) component
MFSGLGLGAIVALVHSLVETNAENASLTQTTAVAQTAITPAASPVVRATATLAPTPAPSRSAEATVAPAAPVVRTMATPAAVSERAAPSGTWRIDEANAIVGTIVWLGNAASRGDRLILDLHKERIAGQPATPCERDTNLHIVVSNASPHQTVPYTEVNCEGLTSTGVVRVSSISGDAFSGSFWNGNMMLGHFDAHKP